MKTHTPRFNKRQNLTVELSRPPTLARAHPFLRTFSCESPCSDLAARRVGFSDGLAGRTHWTMEGSWPEGHSTELGVDIYLSKDVFHNYDNYAAIQVDGSG